MPVVSDPKFVWPPDVDPVVGPDGVLSARVDVAHAGVLLAADWDPELQINGRFQHGTDGYSGGVDNLVKGAGPRGETAQVSILTASTWYGPVTVSDYQYPITEGDTVTFSASFWWDSDDHLSNGALNVRARGSFGNQMVTSWNLSDLTPGEWHHVEVDWTAPAGFSDWYLAIYHPTGGETVKVTNLSTVPVDAVVPQKVRFVRDGQPVRSGNPAYAPGGIAVAYDNEAPLGQGVSYQAVPVMADGTEGTPSDVITLEVDAPTKQTWLKSVNDPDLSIGSTEGSAANPIIVQPVDLTSAGRVETTSIQGSKFPAATWDTHEAAGGDMTVLVYTVKDRDRIIALLDSGPVLVQPARNTGIGQFYCLAGDVGQSIRTYRQNVPVTELSFPVTAVDCPSTVDTPLMIPGLSYRSVAESYSTYKELGQQVPSYLALLGVDWWDGPATLPTLPDYPDDEVIDGGTPSTTDDELDGGAV